MDKLNILFAGTPPFASTILEQLLNSHHTVLAVFTQPDRPKGRGQKLQASDVKQLAQQHDLNIHQPDNLNDQANLQLIEQYNPDVLVVVAYGLLLPKTILDIPRYGCINVHPSLLPRWRGAAPIPHSILSGDKQTGVCIMQMEQGLDSGPLLKQITLPIKPSDTSASLHAALATQGGTLLLQTLDDLKTHIKNATPQDDALATYANKINKQDALIDWQQSAVDIDRKIRAFNPTPVAHTQFQHQPLRIWACERINAASTATPGTIIAVSKQGCDVATGEGQLRLCTIQLAGGKPLKAPDIFNGLRDKLKPGTVLG